MKKMIIALVILASGMSATAQTRYMELYKLPSTEEPYVSQTRYNWSRVADQLTQGCTSDAEKIESIYDWITRNIAYDTSYTVRTADGCFDAKKGVCQGYCELFYRIAEAAGLRVEIVNGISRNIYGTVSGSGHAWIFAYTRDNYGILIDPTWDAGAVNGSEFIRGDYHRSWFGVDPKWMILTHFPKDPSYQLLPKPMSEEEFRSLNYEFSQQSVYGFDVGEIYTRARNHTLSMPDVYSGGEGDIEMVDVPLQAELLVGTPYTFRVRMKTRKELILAAGRWYSNASGDWTSEGDGVYSLSYTPKAPGSVHLCIREKIGTGSAATLLIYKVSAPSGEDVQRIQDARQMAEL